MGWLRYVGVCIALSFSGVAFGGSSLVYMWENGSQKQIMLAEGDGKNPVALTSGDLWHLYPEIDGSGRYVAYVEGTSEKELNVILVDRAKGEKKPLTTGSGVRLHPDFSGNGRYLAYSDSGNITIEDLWTGDRRTIGTSSPEYFPALASDGSFLVYQRNREIVLDLLDGKDPKVLSEGNSMAPALSFDDRYVAYTSKVDENWDIYLLDRQTQKKTRVTTSPAKDFAPAFRADGSLVFASDRSGSFQLYESVDGREGLLVQAEGDLYAPAVSGETAFQQSTLAEMPAPARSSFATARVGDRIYILGGHQGHEHTYPPESFLAEVEYFDLKTGVWGKAAPRPTPCHGYGAVAAGKYIYAFGGFAYSAAHNPKWKSLDVIDRYDTETNTWERLPAKLNKPRSSNVVAQVGSKVYLVAGWNSTPKHDKDYEGEFHRTIEVFDLLSETVSLSSQQLPDPLRRALSGVTVGEEIVLVGGLGQGATHFELLDTVTAWNPATGTWRELPRLPFATFAPAAGLLKGSLHVFGGMFKTGAMEYVYVNHIFELPLTAVAWKHTGRFLRGSKGFSMVVPLDDKRLGVMGGHTYEGDTDAPVRTFETFGR